MSQFVNNICAGLALFAGSISRGTLTLSENADDVGRWLVGAASWSEIRKARAAARSAAEEVS